MNTGHPVQKTGQLSILPVVLLPTNQNAGAVCNPPHIKKRPQPATQGVPIEGSGKLL